MTHILLRNNRTGETRWYDDEMDWSDGSMYLWTEGNYGCDCNRHLFFERAAGIGDDEGEDVGCSEVLYTAVEAVLPTGEVIPLDDQLEYES